MPERTIFYVIWRGAPAGDARKSRQSPSSPFGMIRTSRLSALPCFKICRAELRERIPSKPPVTRRRDWSETSALLENSFVAGYLPKPQTKGGAAAKSTDRPWNAACFFVYDRTGKEIPVRQPKTILALPVTQEKELLANFTNHRGLAHRP